MALRFRKSLRLFPGVRLSFSGGGISTTIGVPGASVSLGKRGAYLNAGIPGSGLSLRVPLRGGLEPPSPARQEIPFHPSWPKAEAAPKPELKPIHSDAVDNLTTAGLSSFKDLLVQALEQRHAASRNLT